MPNALTAPTMPQPSSAPASPLAALADHSASAKARFDKVSQARDLSDTVLEQLSNLAKLGDTVTQDDVVQASGELVASGMSPLEVASLLADMPPGGEALQAWVASHAQAAAANARQVQVFHQLARHEMGMSALRELTGHALVGPPPTDQGPGPGPGAAEPSMPVANALTPPATGGPNA